MTDTKQSRQSTRYKTLAKAKAWLAERAKIPQQCTCAQCRMIVERQAVYNVINARNP